MQSVYGVGRDWPISYDDLVPHYETAERLMAVSGPDAVSYTHLTLPTSDLVQISVVAVQLKKNK